MPIHSINGEAGKPILIRSRSEDPTPPPPDPAPLVLELVSPFVLSETSGVLTPGTTVSIVEAAGYILRSEEFPDGVPYLPEIISREWQGQSEVLGIGDSFAGEEGEAVFLIERVIDPETGLEWTGDPATSQTFLFTNTTPGTAPAAPTSAQWNLPESYYLPEGQTTTFKPRITLAAALEVAGAEVQWTTSSSVPSLPEHWEPIIPYDGDWTTSHKDGETNEWAYFLEAAASRRERFRIRWRLNGSDWSDESGADYVVPVPGAVTLPATPTGFSVTAGGIDGQVVVAATAQSDWGDGTAGELVISASPFISEQTLATGNLQMPESAEGLSVTFSAFAVSAEGLRSAPATSTVTVPGTAPAIDRTQWARFHFSSARQYNSWNNDGPNLYRYGKGSREIQFCHGGDRSPANPNHAAFWEDVSGPWVTTTAEAEWPLYHHAVCNGLLAKTSNGGKFHPTLENTFLYVAGAGRASSANEDLGDGLYYTDDLGENMTRLIGRGDMTSANTYVKGGSGDSLRYRNYFHVVDYQPDNYSNWWFISTDDAIYSSTTGYKGTWSRLSGAPAQNNMGRIGYMKVLPGGNTIWVAADTGLWKSSTGGSGFTKQSPTGLPAGRITVLDFNPSNYDDFYALVYQVGLFRTTNGGSSFSRVTTPTNNIAQVAVSNVDRQHMWLFLIGQNTDGVLYSSNRGSTWSAATFFPDTYGASTGAKFYDVMHANNTGDQTQCRILPSASVASKAIATSACAMWYTANGTNWVKSSDGYSNAAGGEGHGFFSAVGDRIACMMFDIRMQVSTNGGRSWRSGSFAGLPFTSYIGLNCDINPLDTDYVIMTSGKYTTANSSVVVSSDFCATTGNSFRPSFYTSNYGNQDRTPWAAWHGQNVNIAYSLRGKSTNKGTSWTKWTAVETSGNVYASNIGEPQLAGPANARYYDMRGVWDRSPADGDVLYAFPVGARKILRSANAGVSWTVIANRGPGEFGQHVYSFEPDPVDPTLCYWWENGVGLVKWDNGTISVSTGTTPFKEFTTSTICVNPQDTDQIAIMVRENSSKRVPRVVIWLSTNGFNGPFVDVSANLPRVASARSMAVHPTENYLFIHGTSGAYILGLPGGSTDADFYLTQFGAA